MKNNKKNNDWDPEDEFTPSSDCDESLNDEDDFIYKTIQEIKYLEMEGFVRVAFHPNFPKEYLHAKLFWKTSSEIMEEIEHLMK